MHSCLAVKSMYVFEFSSQETRNPIGFKKKAIKENSCSAPLMAHGLNVYWLPERQHKYSNIISFLYGPDEHQKDLIFGKNLELMKLPTQEFHLWYP